MLIGVLSDTHDQFARTRVAVSMLLDKNVQALIHCGDITDTPILDLLVGGIPSYFVFGNNDWDRPGLERYAREQGLTCLGDQGIIELAGKKIGVTHGDRTSTMRSLRQQHVNYLLSGHTHVASDDLDGITRYVNPGALHRTSKPSVCTINLEVDAVRFWEVT